MRKKHCIKSSSVAGHQGRTRQVEEFGIVWMIWTAAIVDKGWHFGDVFCQEIHDTNGWNLLLLVSAIVHSARSINRSTGSRRILPASE